jgi:hypothetical protein
MATVLARDVAPSTVPQLLGVQQHAVEVEDDRVDHSRIMAGRVLPTPTQLGERGPQDGPRGRRLATALARARRGEQPFGASLDGDHDR